MQAGGWASQQGRVNRAASARRVGGRASQQGRRAGGGAWARTWSLAVLFLGHLVLGHVAQVRKLVHASYGVDVQDLCAGKPAVLSATVGASLVSSARGCACTHVEGHVVVHRVVAEHARVVVERRDDRAGLVQQLQPHHARLRADNGLQLALRGRVRRRHEGAWVRAGAARDGGRAW